MGTAGCEQNFPFSWSKISVKKYSSVCLKMSSLLLRVAEICVITDKYFCK